MCVNPVKIFNKYTGMELYVPCGRCYSCLCSSASQKMQRIISDYSSKYNYYFCTLTYNNDNVPNISVSDFQKPSFPLFRGAKVDEEFVIDTDTFPIDYRVLPPARCFLRNFPFKDCIGVLIWSDVQKFFKRLRKNLVKNHGKQFKLSYYAVGEYGETFFRPHFHILFKTDLSESSLYTACRSSWTLCNWDSLHRAFERAINPATYLSLYLATSINLPLVYKTPLFKQRKSHSFGTGYELGAFDFDNVVNSALHHNLTYDVLQIQKNGASVRSSIPLPKYIISHYFPKFKGQSKLSYDEFLSLCLSVTRTSSRNPIIERYPFTGQKLIPQYMTLSNYNLYNIYKKCMLTKHDEINIYNTCNRIYNMCQAHDFSYLFYLKLWYDSRTILFSQSLKTSLTSVREFDNFKNFYYNVDDYLLDLPETLSPLYEMNALDEFSSVSSADVRKEILAHQKLSKFNKNNKIKTHLL